MAFIGRWWQFLRERHEPFGITMMVCAFFAACAFISYQPGVHAPPCSLRLGFGFAVVWLVFLHMRLFDEVKDYQFDIEHNPGRPLARGLISVGEFSAMTLLCVITEIAISGMMKWPMLPALMMVLCFTLLMRMEFFVGDWMRPKLELYATTHTFSAAMISMLIHTIVCFSDFAAADRATLVFALGNWFVFNVFEFGRKTFAIAEEREGVDSYSARLTPMGAVILLLVNIAFAYAAFYYAVTSKFAAAADWYMLGPAAAVSLLVVIAGLVYANRPGINNAKLYRGTVTLYLLAYPASIAAAVYLLVYR
jgi:4-hydroxybenzoate polyprenyltransferase